MPVFFEPMGTGSLVLKLPKEAILAARQNNEIKVYLLSDVQGSPSHLGIVTAFFDDEDEPLMIATPLFSGDDLLADVVSILCQPEFDAYFFDEHDREWLGVRVINSDVDRCRSAFENATFPLFDEATYSTFANRLTHRFSTRNGDDDCFAYTLILGKRLYIDDLVIIDHRPEAYQFREAQSRPALTQLIREDPGPPQERDIAVLFGRVFPADNIYLNPFRADTAKELTEVLIVTERVMLFVEAKDSPNTAASIDRSISRKRQAIQKQIEKASKQLQGGLGYAKDRNGVIIKTASGETTIPLCGRQLLGLVVIREMFDDAQFQNSKPVLNLIEHLQVPIMLIDYPGLHMISLNLRSPLQFIDALHNIFNVGIEHGCFPKSVWNGPPPIID